MKDARGSILAQVLIMTAVASLMCASILRSRLQPALVTAGAVDRVRDDLAAQAAVNRVNEVWSRLGSCATDADAGVRCGGSGCDCVCTIAPAQADAAAATVTSSASPPGGVCLLTAVRQ